MKPSYLRAHGLISVTEQGPLLLTDLQGPFNLACYNDWVRQALPLLQAMAARGPTVSLVRIRGSALTQPEVLQRMREATQGAVQMLGLRAIAFVVDPAAEGAFLARTVYGPLHEGVLPFQVFDEEAPARAWLLTQRNPA